MAESIKRSAVILAGGNSTRFGQDKCLVELAGKPLVSYVYERVRSIVDETLIIVSDKNQMKILTHLFGGKTKILVDDGKIQSPLVGALTGFKNALGDNSLLLACDTPFVSTEIASLLFDLCVNVECVIPRWPNGYIEPLQAVYKTKPASAAAEVALKNNLKDMKSMISSLRRIRYVSTLVLREFDPHLNTFFNINTEADLKKAERLKKF